MLGQWTDYSQLSGSLTYALTRIGGIVLSAATLLAGLVIVGFLSLYIAAEPDVYFKGILRAIPLDRRTIVMTCGSNAVSMLRRWLVAQMLSMVTVGLLVFLGLWLLGLPLAGTLGVIAALLTFIPNLGPILSVATAALLAFAMSPIKGLLAVALFAVVHFLEGNIITPVIQRQIVRLPPALTLIVQLLLAVMAGPLGVAWLPLSQLRFSESFTFSCLRMEYRRIASKRSIPSIREVSCGLVLSSRCRSLDLS